MFVSRTYRITGQPAASASWNMLRTSRGSATPESSITMWSYALPRMKASDTSCTSASKSSSPPVQHAQPLPSSTKSSGAAASPTFFTSFASMFTAATSFTTTPTRSPSRFSRMCCSSVVLPAPRKPESSVTGIGGALASKPAAMSSWARGAGERMGPRGAGPVRRSADAVAKRRTTPVFSVAVIEACSW